MTTPTIVPSKYAGTDTDFLKVKKDVSGAARIYQGAVTVPSGTAAGSTIGLIPFTKGARFNLTETCVYLADIGAGTTNINAGYIYNDDSLTDDTDAFRSGGTEIRSGGFLTIDEAGGVTFEAEGDGWIVIEILIAATDAEGDISFNVVGSYDG